MGEIVDELTTRFFPHERAYPQPLRVLAELVHAAAARLYSTPTESQVRGVLDRVRADVHSRYDEQLWVIQNNPGYYFRKQQN